MIRRMLSRYWENASSFALGEFINICFHQEALLMNILEDLVGVVIRQGGFIKKME